MANIIKDSDLEKVSGGWQYANGPYINHGSYIIYTVVPGDVLSGIAQRFGVTVEDIAKWNKLTNVTIIHAGDQYVIYPKVIR